MDAVWLTVKTDFLPHEGYEGESMVISAAGVNHHHTAAVWVTSGDRHNQSSAQLQLKNRFGVTILSF